MLLLIKVAPEHLSRMHWVSGHEIFHILSIYQYPLWISESLAQYYGYKSLKRTNIKSETPEEMRLTKKNNLPHASIGLYDAQIAFNKTQDMSYYPLFYIKGAAFWQRLDNLLEKKHASLDNYLALISKDNQINNKLNSYFLTKIKKILNKKEYETLLSDFLL